MLGFRATALQPTPTPGADEVPRASDYCPPRWLRNAHLQSILSSSELRRRRGLQRLQALGAVHREHIFDGGDGVRLQGWHSQVPGMAVQGLAILLHGWEGSTESSYMRMTCASLLEAGYEVVRLNFRDHGQTHHLNEDIFHSCRLAEVLYACVDVAGTFPHRPLVLAGYSLGGNFALRVALNAQVVGLPLQRVAAVCPVMDPMATLLGMEQGLPLYHWYFQRKWRRSLERKRALFPERHVYDDSVLALNVREMTRWMVEHETEYGTLDAYLDGYSIAGDRLAALSVPAHILMAQDDPVIPFEHFRHWQLPECAQLEIARWGGHCGFIENAQCDGFGERWVTHRLTQR
ncbi:YheT family hydrolase [Pseudoxanthomonas composti]|uniref:Alpha/beta fold hydrolase n=1 Tax=Pseudoxanthomonas composti TaxID=2137479 RepID=A0A4Q1JUU2_9GAMM|nr:alpha/beta fold hydrolase [Pseudoxanthomonas composti]RXR05896.1 alpha/beta fold hydrolase [Pseudoxanthomonas composti]